MDAHAAGANLQRNMAVREDAPPAAILYRPTGTPLAPETREAAHMARHARKIQPGGLLRPGPHARQLPLPHRRARPRSHRFLRHTGVRLLLLHVRHHPVPYLRTRRHLPTPAIDAAAQTHRLERGA